jgi:hypothetical protein
MVAISETRYDTGRVGGLVPGSWELVCRNRKGDEHVAARHVVTFDVGSDDSVVYSNGYWRLPAGRRRLAAAHLRKPGRETSVREPPGPVPRAN